MRVYVDGIASGPATFPVANLPGRSGTETMILGGGTDIGVAGSFIAGGHLWPSPVMLAGVAFYDSALTAGRVAAHYAVGVSETAATAELSSQRITRLASLMGVPTGTVEVGRSRVSNRRNTEGRGVNQALLEVAESEGGLVFFDGAGLLTFHSRAHRMNQPVGVTLDASADQVNDDLEFEESDAVLLNDVSVDRPRGGPVRTVDEASVELYGEYAETVSSILVSDDETQALGQWLVFRRAMPTPRAGRVSVDPFTDPTLYPAALGTELGTRLRLTNLPATAPESTVDLVIEGIEHTFSVDGWVTTWDTSPADDLAYARWDVDTWDSARWAW